MGSGDILERKRGKLHYSAAVFQRQWLCHCRNWQDISWRYISKTLRPTFLDHQVQTTKACHLMEFEQREGHLEGSQQNRKEERPSSGRGNSRTSHRLPEKSV